MFVGPPEGTIAGTVLVNNQTVEVATQQINLVTNSLNFVYVNLATGAIQRSVFGLIDPAAAFPVDTYPIAVLKTDAFGVLDMADARPDVSTVAGGGGSGSSVDTVVAYVAPQTISIISGQNIFGTCTQVANPLTLPTVQSWMAGLTIQLIKIDASGYVSVLGSVQGISLSNQYQYVTFECDGSNWYVLAGN